VHFTGFGSDFEHVGPAVRVCSLSAMTRLLKFTLLLIALTAVPSAVLSRSAGLRGAATPAPCVDPHTETGAPAFVTAELLRGAERGHLRLEFARVATALSAGAPLLRGVLPLAAYPFACSPLPPPCAQVNPRQERSVQRHRGGSCLLMVRQTWDCVAVGQASGGGPLASLGEHRRPNARATSMCGFG